MVLIEGVGDEVTVFACVLLLLSVLLLAWVSTSVADRPLVSVIVLDGRTFQHFISRLRGQGGVITSRGANSASSSRESTPVDETQTSAEPSSPLEESSQAEDSPAEVSSSETGERTAHRDSDTPGTAASTPTSDSFVHVSRSSSSDSEEAEGPARTDNTTEEPSESSLSPEPVCEAQQCAEPSSSELRQRRLAFFNNTHGGSHNSSSQTTSVGNGKSESPTTAETWEDAAQSSPSQSAEQPSTSAQEPGSGGQSTADEAFEQLDGHIRIRLKYLDDRQRWVQARPDQTIGQFKRTHFQSEMTENTMVRFIYNGRELTSDGQSLASYNVSDESVIHCLVSRITNSNNDHIQPGAVQFDVGSLVFPLFGLILAMIWYSRLTYKQYFNTISTLTLIGISFMFIIALLASFRNNDAPEVITDGD